MKTLSDYLYKKMGVDFYATTRFMATKLVVLIKDGSISVYIEKDGKTKSFDLDFNKKSESNDVERLANFGKSVFNSLKNELTLSKMFDNAMDHILFGLRLDQDFDVIIDTCEYQLPPDLQGDFLQKYDETTPRYY